MRQVAPVLLLLWIMLVIWGCREEPAPASTTRLPSRAFSIGSPTRYTGSGVYNDFRQSHNVWVASDSRMLVVLAAACPHDEASTYFDDMTAQFRCSRCSARFSDMGLPLAGRPDNLALVRLRIELRGERGEPDAELWVNPRVTYRFEAHEWSSRFSLWTFEPTD